MNRLPKLVRQQVELCLGKAGVPLGSLTYTVDGQREYTALAYAETWLSPSNEEKFEISADLPLLSGYQSHKAASKYDSVFHGAIADTAPDAWGRRVIARDHAKRRRLDATLPALTELDYLLAVDDFSRMGALRLRDSAGVWHRSVEAGKRSTPPLIELERVYQATRALERGKETTEDLRYLQGKGTSLGGMRPKCTMLDEDGRLAIGKFPSVGDVRSITRGEVLALKLAKRAGIDAAEARVVLLGEKGSSTPVAVIRRFDRDENDGRIPYQSAASILQALREQERSYTEIADAIRRYGVQPKEDVQQLWRRLVFNLLITNVDDHLHNHGFLHTSRGQWRLAPAFDINPFPDKENESKTWLSEQDGPISDIQMLLARADYFDLDEAEALDIIGQVHAAVADWRSVALHPDVGLPAGDLEDFAQAFEHPQMEKAKALVSR